MVWRRNRFTSFSKTVWLIQDGILHFAMFLIRSPQTQLQLFLMLLYLAVDECVFYAGVVFADFTHWLLLNIEFVQKNPTNSCRNFGQGPVLKVDALQPTTVSWRLPKNKKPTSSLIVCNIISSCNVMLMSSLSMGSTTVTPSQGSHWFRMSLDEHRFHTGSDEQSFSTEMIESLLHPHLSVL